jgi:hypothetical protein
MRLAAIALVIVAAGCASHQADRRPPIRPVEWKSVLNDWYPDSVVDQPHPCAAIVIARAHLAISTTYSTINEDLARAERRSCTRHPDLGALKIGMSDADVAAAAGAPDDTGLRCWVYAVTRAHDGRRICFTSGRVTTLQLSVHG